MLRLLFFLVCVVVLVYSVACVDTLVTPIRSLLTSSCFSEGLAISNGIIYQSCGGHGESSIRALDKKSGAVLMSTVLPSSHFGEGLTVVGDHLFAITWKTRTLFILDSSSLVLVGEKRFVTSNGQGWGLTTDGQHLIFSDGSEHITFFQVPLPDSFSNVDELVMMKSFDVYDTSSAKRIERLNELEFVDGDIYANVWLTDTMVRFSAATGQVKEYYDLSLLSAECAADSYLEGTGFKPQDVVPNGIAYNAVDDTFLLAGKLWPRAFVVQLSHARAHKHKLTLLFGVLFVMAVLMTLLCVTVCNTFCCVHNTTTSDSNPYEAI